MFKGRWFLKILIIAFVAFALMKNRGPQSPVTSSKEDSKFEFLRDVRSSIEVLTADPKDRRLANRDKNKPLLEVEYEDQLTDKSTEEKSTTPATKQPNLNTSRTDKKQEIDGKTWLETKIINIADNLLHTPQGQELLEKFLLNNQPLPNEINPTNKLKDPHHNNSIIELSFGEGPPVQCGDTVTVHYTTRLVNGQEVENTHFKDKPLTFQVGNQQVIKGLEYAVLNMKEEGKRRVVIPPKLAYNQRKHSKGIVANNEFITIDVELLKINPEYQELDKEIRIFENANSNNPVVMCSDPVFFNYTLSTLDGKIFSKSQSHVSFILGGNSVPPAINRAFTNIQIKSKRSVILPSRFIYKKHISFLPPNTKIPPNELILFEINTY